MKSLILWFLFLFLGVWLVFVLIIGTEKTTTKTTKELRRDPTSDSDPRYGPLDDDDGDYDCGDFLSWKEAQRVFESSGGTDNDIYGLDRDNDGVACERLK